MRTLLLHTHSAIRYREALIFQTPAVLGLAVFIPAITVGTVARAALACIGSFLSAASILALNDWADISLDTQNILKRQATFVERGIQRKQMLWLAITLAAAGLVSFWTLSPQHLVAALLAILLGLAYSMPVRSLQGKSIPVLSSVLHFGGIFLSFLLGALTFATGDWRSLVIAAHPAILITAGHLIQEIEDYEQDRISGCRTHAVRFGRVPVFFAAAILFGLSFAVLHWLAGAGFFPWWIKFAWVLYPAYLVMAADAYRAGLARDSIRQLRTRYRALFAVLLVAMLIGSLLQRGLLG